jgi:hypothetical protein
VIGHELILGYPCADQFAEGEAQRMTDKPKRGNWSFKEQRELIKLAAASMSLETIAQRFERSTESVLKMAKQLGVSVKSRSPRK